MATFRRFEDIDAWKKARVLTKEVYSVSKQRPFFRDYALRDQIRRSSSSIMSNIAEGFERGGTKEFINFLSIAKGSAGESRSHLYVALDQEYLTPQTFEKLLGLATEISRMLGGLMDYLAKTPIKGQKYRS
jgi:four helix bundle protein